jgi:glycosyltransferase involved in cell wall biosynthesis
VVSATPPEVSVVLPCLNEEATVGRSVARARRALAEAGLSGEVVVCDNGSGDRSREIARAEGARVVDEDRQGYGYALRRGIEEARGQYVVIADSDDTYDLAALPAFLEPLRRGYQFVVGDRFRGGIEPGAMPWLHQHLGTPLLSLILRLLFGASVRDSQCGMRAFSRQAYAKMRLRTTGMEFASEMLVNAMRAGLAVAEVPVRYFPREGESKLRSFRDGWRHLRFMLLYSPAG